jgi:hypothetical protein
MGNGASQVSSLATRKSNFCPNSLEIEKAGRAVQHLSFYTTEENRSNGSEPTPGIMCGVLGASAFSPPMLCNASLTANGGLSSHVNNVKSTRRGEVVGKASHHAHDLEEEYMTSVSRWSNHNKLAA